MAINGIVGRTRQAKSLYMIKLLRQALLRGDTCYWQEFIPVNLEILLKRTYLEKFVMWLRKVFRFKPKEVGKIIYYKGLKEFVNFENGVIFMDEAQMYFNSRKWQSLPESLQWKLQQHGHDKLDIWLATQNIKRIEPIARELINSLFLVKKFGGKRGLFFTVREYDLADIDKEKKEMYSFTIFWFSWKLAKSYDSFTKQFKKALTFTQN